MSKVDDKKDTPDSTVDAKPGLIERFLNPSKNQRTAYMLIGGILGLVLVYMVSQEYERTYAKHQVRAQAPVLLDDIPTVDNGRVSSKLDLTVHQSVEGKTSCIVIAPKVTKKVASGARERGCTVLEVSYIDDTLICNDITRSCYLID